MKLSRIYFRCSRLLKDVVYKIKSAIPSSLSCFRFVLVHGCGITNQLNCPKWSVNKFLVWKMKYFDYKSRHSVAAIRKLKPHLSADRVASYPDHVRLLRVVAQDNFIIYCLLGFINMSFLILSNSWELPTPAIMLVGRPNWILGPGPNPGSAGIWGHVNWVARWLSL